MPKSSKTVVPQQVSQGCRDLAEAMPHMVWTADASGAINYWNQRWYHYTGLSPGQSMGLTGAVVVHPDERDRTLSAWRQAVTQGQSFEVEYRIRRHDGVYRWFICRGLPNHDDQGALIGWIGTITDIDDQKRLDERLRLVTQAVNGLVFDWDLQTGQVCRSEKLYDLVGIVPADAPPTAAWWRERIHPDDLRRLQPQTPELFTSPSNLYESEYRVRHADGHWVEVWERSRLVRDSQGQVVRIVGSTVDISHRKESERALLETHIQLEAALAAGAVYTWHWQLPENRVYTDRNFAHLFGVDADQAKVGLPIEDFLAAVHGEDKTRVKAAIDHALETGAPYAVEFRIFNADGEERWVVARGRVKYDADGHPVSFPGALADISDRKSTEAQLKASQAQLQQQLAEIETIYQSVPIGLAVVDTDLRFVRINQRLAEINGIPAADHLGHTLRELLPTVADSTEQDLQTILATGEPMLNVEVRGETPAQPGVERTWIEHYLPLKQGDAIVGINVVCEEVTERLRAEAALHQTSKRLEVALKSAPITLFNQDQDLRYTWIYAPVHGFSPEDMIGRTDADLVAPAMAAELTRIKRQVLETGKSLRQEVNLVKDGQTTYFDLIIDPIRDHQNGIVGITCAAVDVSERKAVAVQRERLLQQEQTARAAAERANRVKDEFLAILSHELRSPLNPILGWTKLLQTRQLDEAKIQRALFTIERNAKLQTQLIDDLLDVARILRGKLKLNNTSVNLMEVVEAALDTVRNTAAVKGIDLQFQPASAPANSFCCVSGDAGRLQQIVWNLLSNAIKFTPSRGKVVVHLARTGDRATIAVADTGQGISPDFLPHIFESFRQEDVSITRQHGGLGLGLSIVRYLVEAHGGTITADSPGEGQGATFTVQLPLLPTATAHRPERQSYRRIPDLSGLRIMAVDDEADARQILEAIFTYHGAEVRVLPTASEVMAQLPVFRPHVLISDLGMPGVDGYTLLRQVRQLAPAQGGQTPAIALTAYARSEDRQRALSCGYQKHIPKPFELEDLVRAVADLVQGA